ncbi:MAG TPA: DUF58 domain-containing protein [Planctomycetota bacterium]|nr:DUF58 domain-containing protein [Planctomycetota bacterium]
MASYERFYDPSVLARVQRLELRAKMVVEGIITGMHKSPYHGQSVEFVDHRAYVPGDDTRHIDWKVLGRADRIVLKRYEEETNLRGHVLLDSSESMRYAAPSAPRGQAGLTKFEYAGTLAASIAYLLQRQHDKVGLTLFDSQVRASLPPSTHPTTLIRLAQLMDQTPPAGKTGLGRVLEEIADSTPRRGLVVVISDLFAPVPEIASGLGAFALRRHDVIVFHVLDETELTFPFEGNTLFHGLEDYPEIVADPRSLREAYMEALAEYLDGVEKACSTLGINYLRTHTGEPLDAAVVSVIAARARLGRHYR